MSEETAVMADPFQGGEPTHEEFSKWRQDGSLPERFKPKEETPAAKVESEAKPQDGQEPPKKAEQEEPGKVAAKDPLFTEDQQKAFDKAFAKRERKIRAEFERQIAELTSKSSGKPPAEKATSAPPEEPKLPKLSTFEGTVEDYERAVSDFPAKHAAWMEVQRLQNDRAVTVHQKLSESEAKAHKNHPDYRDEFEALSRDIAADEEPKLADHILRTIAEETDDPHEVTYYLAKNRDEFRRVAALKPHEAMRQILKLEAKLAYSSKGPAPDEKPRSVKPKPPEPVGARQVTAGFDVNDDNTDADTWMKERWKQVRGR